MRPPRFSRGGAAALIAAAAFLCYGGPRVASLGFYRDDWLGLSLMASANSRLEGLRLLAQQPLLVRRPLTVIFAAVPFWLFGAKPLGWQLTLALVNALTAFGVYRVLKAFRAAESLSILAAIVFLAYPSKDTALFWAGYLNGPLALLSFLAAYLAHLSYIEEPRPAKLLGACGAFFICLASYDSCLFLLPVLALTPRPARGLERRRRALSGALLFVTAAATMAGRFLLIRWLNIPSLAGVSPYHFLFVYLASLNANLGPDLAVSCARSVARAFSASPFIASAGLLLPGFALMEERRGPGAAAPEPEACRRLILVGVVFYVLGYLVVAISPYVPAPTAEENRLNLVPAAGLAFILAGWLGPRWKAGGLRAACALGAGLLVAASAGSAESWAEAYRRQLEVRELVLERLPDWPREDVLFLKLPELHVDGKASVFDHEYIIDAAVRFWTQDPGRRSFVLRPGVEFAPEGVRLDGKAAFPYERIVLLDAATGEFTHHPSYAFCRGLAIPPLVHNPVATWGRRLLRLRHPGEKA